MTLGVPQTPTRNWALGLNRKLSGVGNGWRGRKHAHSSGGMGNVWVENSGTPKNSGKVRAGEPETDRN